MKRSLAIVSVGYGLSRVFLYFLGIRFEGMKNLHTFLQIIDPPLLEHHLLSSLYYSTFPPFYNLLVGVVLKLFGESSAAFAALNLLTGWALALVMCALLLDLGIVQWLAIVGTLVFLQMPPVILYENWLFYSYQEALFFTLAAWCFLRFSREPRIRWGLSLFLGYAALALLNARMMFFILVIAGLLAWLWRRRPAAPNLRRTLALSALPLLFVLVVMAKNAWLFGAFSVDPHFGFHMGNGFIYIALQDPEIHAVCERDYPILLIPPMMFPPADKVGLPPTRITGVPLLDNPLRSGGQPNYDTLYVLEVSQLYTEALVNFVVDHPLLYGRFVRGAFLNFWESSNHYIFFPKENRQTLGAYDSAYTRAYPLLLLFYVAGLLHALYAGWRARWKTPETATLGLMVAIVGYTMLAIFVTTSENDRYKFTVEPILWILALYAVHTLVARTKRRPSPSPDAPTPGVPSLHA